MPPDADEHSPALGLALLDATGLGIGHFLMHRVRGGIGLVVGTLVTIGIAAAAPGVLSPLLLLLWLVISGLLGYRAARRSEIDGNPRFYLGFGVACLFLLAGGYAFYVHAADNTYASALAAHRYGDCDKAVDHYNRVDDFYSLSFRSFDRLEHYRSECRALLHLDALVDQREFEQALAGYASFTDDHPEALVGLDALARRRAAAYSSWGNRQLAQAKAKHDPDWLALAARHYDQALGEDVGFAAAHRGFGAVRRLAASGDVCRRAAYIEALAEAKYNSALGTDLGAESGRAAPALLLRCGRSLLASGQAGQAARSSSSRRMLRRRHRRAAGRSSCPRSVRTGNRCSSRRPGAVATDDATPRASTVHRYGHLVCRGGVRGAIGAEPRASRARGGACGGG